MGGRPAWCVVGLVAGALVLLAPAPPARAFYFYDHRTGYGVAVGAFAAYLASSDEMRARVGAPRSRAAVLGGETMQIFDHAVLVLGSEGVEERDPAALEPLVGLGTEAEAAAGETGSIPWQAATPGERLTLILRGEGLPPRVRAAGSPLLGQYDPGAPLGIRHPTALPASDLTRMLEAESEVLDVEAAIQPFERGWLFWRGDRREILALYRTEPPTWAIYVDTWTRAQPAAGPEEPPPGLHAPRRGFGKLWRENPLVRERLGWALAPERGTPATFVAEPDGSTTLTVGDLQFHLAWDAWQQNP